MYGRSSQLMLAVAVAILFMVAPSSGHSDGAGGGACIDSSMAPSHYGSAAQSTNSPYAIMLNTTVYKPGASITVTLKGSSSFKGFLTLALPEQDPTSGAVGNFSITEDAGVDLSQPHCGGGATHTKNFSSSNPARDTIELTWNAPMTSVGNIKFYVTFVKQLTEFWIKVPSATVMAGNMTHGNMTSGDDASTTPGSTVEKRQTTISMASNLQLTSALLICDFAMWMMLFW